MRHATEPTLAVLEDLLEALRGVPGLREKKRGTFYRGSQAFLHFHEDAAGIFADIKFRGDWQRVPVNRGTERRALLRLAREYSED